MSEMNCKRGTIKVERDGLELEGPVTDRFILHNDGFVRKIIEFLSQSSTSASGKAGEPVNPLSNTGSEVSRLEASDEGNHQADRVTDHAEAEDLPRCAYIGPCPYCDRDGWKCQKVEGWVGHNYSDPNFVHRFVGTKREAGGVE